MFGWLLNIPYLTNASANWIPMKFITALSFSLSGVCLYLMAVKTQVRENFFRLTLLIGNSLSVFLFMATLFFSYIFKIPTGIENLFVQETSPVTIFSAPGLPSLITMIDFTIFSIACILFTSTRPEKSLLIKISGLFITSTGVVAVLGFIFNLPILYFVWPSISTAIAPNTSIVFIILGLGLSLVGMNL